MEKNIDLDLEIFNLTEEQSAILNVLIAAYSVYPLNDKCNDMVVNAIFQYKLYVIYCSFNEEQKRIEKERIEKMGKLFPIF